MSALPATPRVSVVLPVYNAEPFVAAAVQSVLSQTLEDFELIVLNDGSTDSSLAEIERVAGADHRVRIMTRANRGLIATLNEGVALARGPWVARMDADDLSAADRFAIQLRHLETSGADICGSAVTYFGDSPDLSRAYPESDPAVKFRLLFDCALAHPAVMARASLLKANPYDSAARHAEDYELWCRLAMKGARFGNVAKPLLRYRRHGKQISSQHRDEQRSRADAAALPYVRWYLREHGLASFAPLVEKAWAGRRAPHLRSYAALLWQLEERLGIRDPHIDAHLCATAAARGIGAADALALHRAITRRGDAPVIERLKLLVSGLLGRAAYAGSRRLNDFLRNAG